MQKNSTSEKCKFLRKTQRSKKKVGGNTEQDFVCVWDSVCVCLHACLPEREGEREKMLH